MLASVLAALLVGAWKTLGILQTTHCADGYPSLAMNDTGRRYKIGRLGGICTYTHTSLFLLSLYALHMYSYLKTSLERHPHIIHLGWNKKIDPTGMHPSPPPSPPDLSS